MEPPAVTSCGVGHPANIGNVQQHGQSQKRDNMSSIGFLQIEPQISFNAANRHFEELPENFLETISPQQHGIHGHSMLQNSILGGSAGHDGAAHSTTSPQLASLTTVSMAGGANGNSGYANLVPMPSSSHSHYISASLKMESMEHMAHHSQMRQTSQLEKTNFGNGPAGLLSPLQLESNRGESNSLSILGGGVHHHRPNGGGRTSDLLSGIRRNNVSYIKEEVNPAEIGYQTAHDYDGSYSMQQPSAQELERMANAETPPALSNVEITSSILASLSRDSPSPNIQHQQSSPPTHFIVHQMPRPPPQQQQQQQQPHMMHPAIQTVSGSRSSGSRSKAKHNQQQQQQQQEVQLQRMIDQQNALNVDAYSIGTGPTMQTITTYPPPPGEADPLNAEIDDEIYIDTKDLCKRVAYELKQHSIPQAIFAERILCRSQGTLSDLLRNPKPWNRLKSGRETFKRMYNWLQQPLHIRLTILDMYKGPMASGVIPPPTPAQNSRHHHRRRTSTGDDGQGQKRPRLVFTDIQKRTLQAIFKETQRPSREMQQTIAEHLRLDMSTVSNFFMNARRRSRNGNGLGDEPAPYQQIRTITPPPDSPPTAQQQMLNEQQQQPPHPHHQPTPRSRAKSHHQPTSSANLSHIEETVDEVVGRSIAYARKTLYAPPVSHEVIEQPPVWEEEVQTAEGSFIGEGGVEDTTNMAIEANDGDESRNNMDEADNNSEANPEEFAQILQNISEPIEGIKEEKSLTEEEEETNVIDGSPRSNKEEVSVTDPAQMEVEEEERQAAQALKSETPPPNDAEAPTAPGTPINDGGEVEAAEDGIEHTLAAADQVPEEDSAEKAGKECQEGDTE